MKKKWKRFFIWLLISCMLVSLTGCSDFGIDIPIPGKDSSAPESSSDPNSSKMAEDSSDPSGKTVDLSGGEKMGWMLGLKMLNASLNEHQGENVMVSPFSAEYALALAMNGAGGATLEEMEKALGISTEDVTDYLRRIYNLLPDSQTAHLSIANAIFTRGEEDFSLAASYKLTVRKDLMAELFVDDGMTDFLSAINSWVNEKTEGMIPYLLDSVPEGNTAVLINALAFVADWETPYEEGSVIDGVFRGSNGEETIPFMHSEEKVYLKDEYFEGMMKYYHGKDYAFAALLPVNGDLGDTLQKVSEEDLVSLLMNPAEASMVFAALPKFEISSKDDLKKMLIEMGIEQAFDPDQADFSNMISGDEHSLYIKEALQKTYISVFEAGTKAGAATAIVMNEKGMQMNGVNLTFDQPFLFMIIDTSSYTPLFMGVYQKGEVPVINTENSEEAEE